LKNQIFIIPPKNFSNIKRRPYFFARTITELKATFATAVTLKQQRVLLQQGNQHDGDSQQMEFEVLTECGQIAEVVSLIAR